MVKITEKNRDDVLPVLSTTILVAVLAFADQQQRLHHHTQHWKAHESFLLVTSLVALGNVTGLPKKVIREQWETSGFGKAFFAPIQQLKTTQQRRQAAGILEFLGILLGASDLAVGALCGYLMLALLYARGASCHVQVRNPTWKVGFAVAIALWAAWLASLEVQILWKEQLENIWKASSFYVSD